MAKKPKKKRYLTPPELARLRWSRTTKAERRAHAVKMNQARWAKARAAAQSAA